jgi:4'-phosphopantetheinyl transferase EntD
MKGAALCRTLRELVPTGVCVAAGQALATSLTVSERGSLGVVDAERTREFASGRAHAKRALAMLGIVNADLPIGPDRAPVWPTGVVGSITHVRCGHDGLYAAAVVARTEVASAVGVDFELDESLHPTVWRCVLTQRELERVLALPADARRKEVHYIWCAKEAAAKTMSRQLDLSELEVDHEASSGYFVAGFSDRNGRNRPIALLGRTACLDRLLIAAVVVPPGERATLANPPQCRRRLAANLFTGMPSTLRAHQ